MKVRLTLTAGIALLLSLVVVLVGAGSADANFKGQNGLIAFDSWTGTSQDIGVFDPSGAPSISLARFAITSLTFMLVWVPEPVCQTTRGK